MNIDHAPLRKVEKIGKILGNYQFSPQCNASFTPAQVEILSTVIASKLTFEEIAEFQKLMVDAGDFPGNL